MQSAWRHRRQEAAYLRGCEQLLAKMCGESAALCNMDSNPAPGERGSIERLTAHGLTAPENLKDYCRCSPADAQVMDFHIGNLLDAYDFSDRVSSCVRRVCLDKWAVMAHIIKVQKGRCFSSQPFTWSTFWMTVRWPPDGHRAFIKKMYSAMTAQIKSWSAFLFICAHLLSPTDCGEGEGLTAVATASCGMTSIPRVHYSMNCRTLSI